jgi:ankyrin repeat protein
MKFKRTSLTADLNRRNEIMNINKIILSLMLLIGMKVSASEIFDINSRDADGRTQLMNAVTSATTDYNRNLVTDLLNTQGIDVNTIQDYREGSNSNGNTALHYAVMCMTATQQLLEVHSINVNVQNNEGITPLMIAVENNDIATATELLNRGAILTIANQQWQTVADLATTDEMRDLINSRTTDEMRNLMNTYPRATMRDLNNRNTARQN